MHIVGLDAALSDVTPESIDSDLFINPFLGVQRNIAFDGYVGAGPLYLQIPAVPIVVDGTWDDSEGQSGNSDRPSNDIINGGLVADRLFGGSGDDTLRGFSGNDHLFGGDDDDELYGMDNNDTLRGEADDDILYGGSGNDSLQGDGGNDELHGGEGNDTLDGGTGNDTAVFRYNWTEYAPGSSPGGLSLSTLGLNSETDTLISIERLQFADRLFTSIAQYTSAFAEYSNPTPPPPPPDVPVPAGQQPVTHQPFTFTPPPAGDVPFSYNVPQGVQNPNMSVTGAVRTELAAGESIPIADLFPRSGWDGDGENIAFFAVSDITSGGGYITLNDVRVPDFSYYEVPISFLPFWAFVAGEPGTTDELRFTIMQPDGDFSPRIPSGAEARVTSVMPDLPELHVADVSVGGQDLAFGDLVTETFDNGDRISANYDVENRGDADAVRTTTALYIYNGSSFEQVDTERTSTIRDGRADSSEEMSFRVPSSLRDGIYSAFIVPDVNNDQPESDESGARVFAFKFTVQEGLPPPPELVNLTAGSFLPSAAVVTIGEAVNFQWAVQNEGNATAGTFDSGVYISNDPIVTTSDRLLVEAGTSSSLTQGSTRGQSVDNFAIPADLAPGTYYVAAIVDNRGVIVESQKVDNASNVIEILIEAPLPPPDTSSPVLSTTLPADDATGVAIGANMVMDFNEAVRAGAGNVEIFQSNGTLWRSINVTNINQVSFSGSTMTINPGVDLAASTGYYLRMASGVVRDAAGNSFAGITSSTALNFATVGVDPTSLPDVSVSNLEVVMRTDGSGLFDATFSVQNDLAELPYGASVALRLSSDQIIFWEGDYFLGSVGTGQMDDGDSLDLTITGIDLDWVRNYSNFAPGTYYFAAEADYDGSLNELDEQNNISNLVQIDLDFPSLTLIGGDGEETLNGGNGHDTFHPGAGNDLVQGGDGDDQIFAGSGADYLIGDAGDETITLVGTSYHSAQYVAFNVSSANQTGTSQRINLDGKVKIEAVIDGGADFDTIYLSDQGDAFFLHDAYSGFHQSLTLFADYVGNDSIQRFINIQNINGLGGDDIIDLTSPDYSLVGASISIDGGAGNDVVWGSDADETIYGGAGNDTIFGGTGTDVLFGGVGADVFEFTRTSTDTTVMDFNAGEGDQLRFYNAGDADFDPTSIGLTENGIRIAYVEAGTRHEIDIVLAASADDFNFSLQQVLSSTDFF